VYRIGQFSKISRLPVKTLRFYDDIGLLKADHVDPYTGYRYYDLSQLTRVNRILALKDLGLSLEQTATMLDKGLTVEQLKVLLRRKRAELTQNVLEVEDRLARIEARLRQIEIEGIMPEYDITVKEIQPLKVASVRGVLPTYAQQGHLWAVLEKEMAKQGIRPTGPCFTSYLNNEYREHDIDAEVCYPIEGEFVGSEKMEIKMLPGGLWADTIHHGPLATLSSAYGILFKWIEANGYRITDPEREIYLKVSEPVRQNDPGYLTEIQFPVERKTG